MTTTNDSPHKKHRSRFFRFVMGIVIYGLLGPPIGFLTLLPAMIFLSRESLLWPPGIFLAFAMLGIVASYVLGGISALSAGLLVSLGHTYYRRFRIGHVLMIGVLVGAGHALWDHFFTELWFQDPARAKPFSLYANSFVACFGSTVACWWLLRRWLPGR